METWMIFAIFAVFAFAIGTYVLFVVFFPEWIGITGKTALKAEESHGSGTLDEDESMITKWQKK